MTMKRHFDEDLDVLRGKLLEMGGLCEDMIHDAVKILTERDEVYLADVQAKEGRVNDLHIEIDEVALRLIALHQPAAGDLRLIAAALKINSDLERIGDQAVNIAETGIYLARMPRIKLGDIPRMVEVAVGMTKDSLDAFSRRDVELARSVIARDDEEDALKSQTFNELIGLMQSDASTIQRGMDIILVARNLERIADHATNIAEDVIFMVLGKDIRHHAEEKAAAAERSPEP
ncbi:MAG: phosphate signaling complex protein PhoU [Elusimicrobiota bacterium]